MMYGWGNITTFAAKKKRTDMNGLRLTREEVIGRARKALERKREAIARGQEILKQQTAGAQIAVS